jgi:hypothetical protein
MFLLVNGFEFHDSEKLPIFIILFIVYEDYLGLKLFGGAAAATLYCTAAIWFCRHRRDSGYRSY